MDGYEREINRALAVGRRSVAEGRAMLERTTRTGMRESGDGEDGGLLDLSDYVPTRSDAGVATAPEPGWDGVERSQQEMTEALAEAGLSMCERGPGLRQRIEGAQFATSKMRESALALVDKHETVGERLRKMFGVRTTVPLTDGASDEMVAVFADEPVAEGDELVDLSGPGVPSVTPLESPPAEEILKESQAADAELNQRVREFGEYGGGAGTPTIAYPDGTEYEDVADLYVVLPQTLPNGSVNLECAKVEAIAQDLLQGKPMNTLQIGLVRELLAKYSKEVAALRAGADKGGQDYGQDARTLAAQGRVVDPGTAGDNGAGGGNL